MIRNNYDTNSKGRSIEASAFYDTDLASIYFKESFEVLKYASNCDSSNLYYIDCGNLPGEDSVKISIKSPKSEIVKYLADRLTFESEEIATWPDSDLESEVFASLSNHLTIYNLEECESESGLEFATSKHVQSLRVTGFCHGDISRVYFCPTDMLRVWKKCQRIGNCASLLSILSIARLSMPESLWTESTTLMSWTPMTGNGRNLLSMSPRNQGHHYQRFSPCYLQILTTFNHERGV